MKHFMLFGIALTSLLPFFGCQPKLSYSEMETRSFIKKDAGVELFFETRSGKQSAFFLFPKNYAGSFPKLLVTAYPGIGSRALDWIEIIDHRKYHQAGFLLIDYPGRGNCEGLMRPKYLSETTTGAVMALKNYLNADPHQALPKRFILLGHSFGCAVALEAAMTLKPEHIVLIAPFTTLHKALFKKIGPLAWFNPDRMDNRKRIKELCSLPQPPLITIIHGNNDRTVPLAMGKELSLLGKGCVIFHEKEGAGHMDVLTSSEKLISDIILFHENMIGIQ